MTTICLVRHGDRFDINNYNEWQNSPGYKENGHYTPLSELGFVEILKLKGFKGVQTLETVYLRKIQQGLSHSEFFRPINSAYFGDKPAYGLMIKFSGKEMNIIE